MWSRLLVLVQVMLLVGCSADNGTGPLDVKWDRDTCERCRMVLSDRKYAAQIRYFPPDKKRSVVNFFDDIGCAVLWLSDKPWQQDPKTEIWVTDHRSGAWIDATQATYVSGQHTPMEYGLGAQQEKVSDGLNFKQAKQYIQAAEERNKIHTAHLLERLKEQQKKRGQQNGSDDVGGGE
ncbi:MAG: nitrous oxide reductase accessory protein NosL [Candidatus Thiodiazotropha sp. 6PDIVS]